MNGVYIGTKHGEFIGFPLGISDFLLVDRTLSMCSIPISGIRRVNPLLTRVITYLLAWI